MSAVGDRAGEIVVESCTKRFGSVTAVDDVTLTIPGGEFFSMLGPSGCGKTTTLRMIAGFETPDAGGSCCRAATSRSCRPRSAT